VFGEVLLIEELEIQARRLEQQIIAYEKLHTDEIKRFQEQFEAFQRIQAEELQMLRKQLAQFAEEIAAVKESPLQSNADESETASPQSTLTRRDLLMGKLPPFRPDRSQG